MDNKDIASVIIATALLLVVGWIVTVKISNGKIDEDRFTIQYENPVALEDSSARFIVIERSDSSFLRERYSIIKDTRTSKEYLLINESIMELETDVR